MLQTKFGGVIMLRKLSLLAIFLTALLVLAGCNLNKKIGESISKGILDSVAKEEASEDVSDADEKKTDSEVQDEVTDSEDQDSDAGSEEDTETDNEEEDTEDSNDGEEFTYHTDEGEVNFDGDGDYTFEGEDGEVMNVSEDNEWPVGMAADLLPKFGKGTIIYSMNLSTGCMVSITGIELNDYKDYIGLVKAEGYTGSASESSSEDASAYTAYKDEDKYIYVLYSAPDGGISITLSIEDSTN
jgi:Sec-independent protein translocase protein TatA